MKISASGLTFIKQFEGLRLKAYQDQAGIWTIGYGSTQYDNGEKVKEGDVITVPRALELLEWGVNTKATNIAYLIKAILNQNQVDAILCLTYNIGAGAFAKSTVLREINLNPNDPAIRTAWLMWDKAKVNGELVQITGLHIRRAREVALYFTP